MTSTLRCAALLLALATPLSAPAALSRFAAETESFELVGVVEGRQLKLYLDRFADNTPVRGAQIDLDLAGHAYQAKAAADDSYLVELRAAPEPGLLPVTATVTVGAEADLLAAELDVHADAHDAAAAGAQAPVAARAWSAYAAGAGAGAGAFGLLLLLALFVRARRRRHAAPELPVGGAA